MKFLKKIGESLLALLPLMVIVLFVHIFLYKFDTSVLIKFFIAILFVALGETFLLSGIDSTIMPMGELMVNSVNKASKFAMFVLFAIIFGMCATIAEPDVTVFSEQVIGVGMSISKTLLVFAIGAGVGVLIALAIFRILKCISVKYLYLIIFAIIFLLCTQIKTEYIAIAFDAGGATTGIITAPFLLAISTGISSRFTKNKSETQTFGMVGLASLGPILAVLLVFMTAGKNAQNIAELLTSESIYVIVLKSASLAVIPLMMVFFLYDFLFIRLPLKKKMGFVAGLGITFVGLLLFLFGIEFGITEMGKQLGTFIKNSDHLVIVAFCIILGFIITFTEPSVIVLSKQVESVTKGNIPYLIVIISIAVAMAFAIVISVLKIIFHINFFYIIMIGYLIALLLMFVVPSIFTSLAFDSGGVASGPMTSAFLLPVMIEVASNTSSSLDGFGLIGIVSMMPIIVLQVLGLVYKINLAVKTKKEQKRSFSIAYSAELYSNMHDLEIEHERLMKEKKYEKQR